MALKFKLQASPTFVAPVNIPVAGGKPVPVKFTFKFRKKTDFLEYLDALNTRNDKDDNVALVLEVACAWELEEPFDAEHLKELDENYVGALKAVFDTYLRENGNARLGN